MYEQKSITETVDILKCNIDSGLSTDEADNRIGFSGKNEISPKGVFSLISLISAKLTRPFTIIMLISALLLAVYGQFAAFTLFFIATGAEIFLDLKNGGIRSSFKTLSDFAHEKTTVKRDGGTTEIDISELVSGDIVILEAGKPVPADLRLIKSSALFIDESPLTGKPMLTPKDALFIAPEPIPFEERHNMAYMGSRVVVGEGEGVVCAVGRNTEMGQAAYLLEDQVKPESPLQKIISGLRLPLLIFLGGSALLSILAGFIRGLPVADSFFLGLTALISAYPAGIGFVTATALTLGVAGIVRSGIALNRPAAVSSLGSLDVLCLDKTGTLTRNHTCVNQVYYDRNVYEANEATFALCGPLITGFALCSSLEDDADHPAQGHFESALLELTESAGMSLTRIQTAFPRVGAIPYKTDHPMATTLHTSPGGSSVSFTMGCLDILLSRIVDILCEGEIRPITEEDIVDIEAAAMRMSGLAFDVTALCTRRGDNSPTEDNLVFVGLAGMSDPLREDAPEIVRNFRENGIRIVLLSEEGRDRAVTAARLLSLAQNDSEILTAEEIEDLTDEQLAGLARDVNLYTGITPSLKLRIIKALRACGEVAGITGRGIWDCPALLASDLGIALADGSATVREAADLAIREQSLQGLGKAAARGRVVFENIKTSMRYLFAANIAEVGVLLFSAFMGGEPPLTPLQILWVNIIALLLPAAAFGAEPLPKARRGSEQKSRSAAFLDLDFVLSSVVYGVFIGFATMLAFTMGGKIAAGNFLIGNEALAVSRGFAFCTLSFSMLFHIPGTRGKLRSVFTVNPFSNRLLLLSFILGFAVQVALCTIPFLAGLFAVNTPAGSEWVMIVTLGLIPLILHELIVFVSYLVNRLGK